MFMIISSIWALKTAMASVVSTAISPVVEKLAEAEVVTVLV